MRHFQDLLLSGSNDDVQLATVQPNRVGGRPTRCARLYATFGPDLDRLLRIGEVVTP